MNQPDTQFFEDIVIFKRQYKNEIETHIGWAETGSHDVAGVAPASGEGHT